MCRADNDDYEDDDDMNVRECVQFGLSNIETSKSKILSVY